MLYSGHAFGQDCQLSVEREGIRLADRFLDYADLKSIRPINHRVFIDTLGGETVEVSMLGFSYDGFLEELTRCFADRSMEALFADEEVIMRCEGEYRIPGESGRGTIILLPDAVCVLPPTVNAVRIPLCFTRDITLNGYMLDITMRSGVTYTVGRMGYDTVPFAERTADAAKRTKESRDRAVAGIKTEAPFDRKGLFRTQQPELYWLAAMNGGRFALELFTGDDAATYLYRYDESDEEFIRNVEEAMEAVGVNREIIFIDQDKLDSKPLYRMALQRSEAVRFLRQRSDGRLIHSSSHAQRLREYLMLK